MGIGEFQDIHLHRRHIEDGRQEIVRERRVAQLAVHQLDLFHQSQPEALGRPALDLPDHGLRIQRPSYVLRGGDLNDLHQP